MYVLCRNTLLPVNSSYTMSYILRLLASPFSKMSISTMFWILAFIVQIQFRNNGEKQEATARDGMNNDKMARK